MKKRLFTGLLAVMVVVSMLSTSVFAVTSDAGENSLADDFSKVAAKMAREHYEELGYVEVESPITKENIRSCADISSECVELAYMDIDNAPVELQQKILDARREIIYKADGWYVADGRVYVTWFDDEEKTWGELPTFEELFPGWEVPIEQNTVFEPMIIVVYPFALCVNG